MIERYTSGDMKAPQEPPRLEIGVRELRDNLSRWLGEVKAGREIVVTERGRPVARLVPSSGGSHLESLIAQGIVTPPSAPRLPASSIRRVRARGAVSGFVAEQRR
jgi:prevent-host-death family protein